MFFKRSYDKTKEMEKLISVINDRDKEKIEKVTQDFYEFIKKDPVLGEVIILGGIESKDFLKVINYFISENYVGYTQKGNHIPVSLLSFKLPLAYLAGNKDNLTDEKIEEMLVFDS